LSGIARLPVPLVWGSTAALLWLATAANAVYFRFFRSELPWWTVRFHLEDLAVVHGSAGSLVGTWPLVLSAALAAAAVLMVRSAGRAPRDGWRARARRAAFGLAALLAALLVRQSPVWLELVHVGETHRGNVLTNQVVV